MAYLDLNKLNVGDAVAIDSGRSYGSFIFCHVIRVTKTQVEVRADSNDKAEPHKFSKITGNELNGSSWDKRRLVLAEEATQSIAWDQAKKAKERERADIRNELKKIGEGYWNEESIAAMMALTARIAKYVTEDKMQSIG